MRQAMVCEESLCAFCQRPIHDDDAQDDTDVVSVFCDDACQEAYWSGLVEATP